MIDEKTIDAALIREDFAAEELWTKQTESSLIPPYTLDELLVAAEMEMEGDERRAPEERGLYVAARRVVAARERDLRVMREQPLTHCWVPDDWWLFLHELCKKRIAQPGAVLELFVSGGIRAGKSFIAGLLAVVHVLYTKKANVFGLSRTEKTSEKLQQQPVAYFLPAEVMGGEKGSIKQTKDEKLKFSGGKFTDGQFSRFVDVQDEEGNWFKGGGSVEFRMFKQEVESYRGYALTFVWSDEAVPVEHVEAVFDRLASRAIDTRERSHRERMVKLEVMLRRLVEKQPGAQRPHPALLGALMHGVHLITYTPEEGYTPMVRRFLHGAHKPDAFKVVAPELENKPGVQDPTVPRIAYPTAQNRLVCYLHTSQNKAVNVYPELSAAYRDSDEKTIRIKLYGDAEAAERSLFGFDPTKHIVPETALPREATLYEVADPAPAKPWVIKWYLVDVVGRVWVVQEWPCESWAIPQVGLPGPWAVPTAGNNVNGDKGPAQKLTLPRGWADYTRRVWLGRQRLAQKLRALQGEACKVPIETKRLEWRDKPDWTLEGEFAMPFRSLMDSRFAAAPTVSQGFASTALEELNAEENAIRWEPASGGRQEDGLLFVQSAMSDEVLGLPKLVALPECTNTHFSWATFTLPEFSESTRKSDEACKDFVDPDRYLLQSEPRHVPPRTEPTWANSWGGY